MATEATLERLRRVRAMKSSPFPEEADTARRMLDKLLAREGLSEKDLDRPKAAPVHDGPAKAYQEAERQRATWNPAGQYWNKPKMEPEPEPPEVWVGESLGQLLRFAEKLTDEDVSYELWDTAATVAGFCENSANGYMRDMYVAISTRYNLTRPQARGVLNFVLGRIRSLRATRGYSKGLCVICGRTLHPDSFLRGICWDDFMRVIQMS